jgi:hypothetical protein
MKSLNFESRKILIVVKAYPTPSISYGETVCCVGIDLDAFQWIRLYPICFRDLEYKKQFKKYSIIEAECAKAHDDLRPESYRIREDSIRVLDHIDTKAGGWEKRKSIVLRLPVKSQCQLLKEEEKNNISLGIIKPVDISFNIKKRARTDSLKRDRAYAQQGFFKKRKEPAEEIPYRFYYRFRCPSEAGCTGHNLSILDWEIHQSFRDWRNKYRDEGELLNKIKARWMDIADCETKNVFFYTGNLFRFPKTFTILGIFYPPL